MRALGLIELKGTGERFQHTLRDPVQVPSLKAGVVVDADSGEQCDFFPTQSWNPPVRSESGQAGLFRRDPGPPGDQEVANFAPVVHDHDATASAAGVGGPGITCIDWDSSVSSPASSV